MKGGWKLNVLVALTVGAIFLGFGLLVGTITNTREVALNNRARADLILQANIEGCARGNQLRGAINRFNEAFIHHNDGTWLYFKRVIPYIQGNDQPTRIIRDATLDVIRLYEETHREIRLFNPSPCRAIYEKGADPVQTFRPLDFGLPSVPRP